MSSFGLGSSMERTREMRWALRFEMLRVLVVMGLHCLEIPGQVLVMLHLADCIKSYNNRFKQHLANEDSVESKSELDRYLLESYEDLKWKILTSWCGGKWILLDTESFPKLLAMCWLFLSLQLHPSLLLVRGGMFWIRSIVHYLLIQLKPLFVPKISWRMQRKKDQ